MAEFTLPPEMEAFAEAAGDAAMGPFQAADFAADPGAAFSEGMGAAMDFMADAGMPPDMMANIADVAQGCFDAHMASNPGSDPMEAFDAVGAGLDMHMAEFPADMPCMDMAGDFPPPPDDYGPMMDGAPPYGDFMGGAEFDAGAMPDTWEPGPMTDMGPGPEGPMAGDMPPGDMPPGDPMGEPGPMDGGPGGPGDMPPGDMGPGAADMGPPTGDMPPGDPMGEPGPMDGGPGGPGDMPPGGPDPLFGDAGAAGGPPPGDMPPGDMPPGDMGPGGPPPGADMDGDGMAPPDPMGDMHTHMDDAGAHHGPEAPPAGADAPVPGDMPADMPPPPDDPNDGGEVV